MKLRHILAVLLILAAAAITGGAIQGSRTSTRLSKENIILGWAKSGRQTSTLLNAIEVLEQKDEDIAKRLAVYGLKRHNLEDRETPPVLRERVRHPSIFFVEDPTVILHDVKMAYERALQYESNLRHTETSPPCSGNADPQIQQNRDHADDPQVLGRPRVFLCKSNRLDMRLK